MSRRRGLGRGLDALIPQREVSDRSESGLLDVPVEAISPNPRQPRGSIDDEKLLELADSIREHGLIQPLIVNRVEDDQFTLIAGERRWRAAQIAGLREVSVIIKETSPQSMLELALVENVQRADLNALEEALAYRQLIDEFGLTQEEVAKRVGKSRPSVANMVRLLGLPDNVQAAIVDGAISGAHARALLPLPTPEAQTAVMKTIIRQGLSVRQVEQIVKKMLSGTKPRPKPAAALPPEIVALESEFQQVLGTRVNIRKDTKGGKVIIHFYSEEELHAIYAAIVGED